MSKNFQKKAWIYKRQGILGLGIPRGPDFSPPFGGDLPSINPTKPMKTASNSYVKCFLESPDGGKSCESLKKKGRVAVIHFCKLLSSKQVLETYQKKFSTNILSPQKFQQLPFLHQFHHRPHNTTCSEKKYIKILLFPKRCLIEIRHAAVGICTISDSSTWWFQEPTSHAYPACTGSRSKGTLITQRTIGDVHLPIWFFSKSSQ